MANHNATQVKLLIDDVHYQINCQTYEVDEIAARFHHRLVAVHPFANGNGRRARFIADFLLLALNRPRFSWGGERLYEPTLLRKQYISALRAADKHDYRLLLAFVRK